MWFSFFFFFLSSCHSVFGPLYSIRTLSLHHTFNAYPFRLTYVVVEFIVIFCLSKWGTPFAQTELRKMAQKYFRRSYAFNNKLHFLQDTFKQFSLYCVNNWTMVKTRQGRRISQWTNERKEREREREIVSESGIHRKKANGIALICMLWQLCRCLRGLCLFGNSENYLIKYFHSICWGFTVSALHLFKTRSECESTSGKPHASIKRGCMHCTESTIGLCHSHFGWMLVRILVRALCYLY